MTRPTGWEPVDCNPDFLAWWEAMDPEEYAFSLRDIPDHILEAEPADDLPEEIRLAWQRADADLLADPLADPPGPVLAAQLAEATDDELGDAALIDRITGFDRQARPGRRPASSGRWPSWPRAGSLIAGSPSWPSSSTRSRWG